MPEQDRWPAPEGASNPHGPQTAVMGATAEATPPPVEDSPEGPSSGIGTAYPGHTPATAWPSSVPSSTQVPAQGPTPTPSGETRSSGPILIMPDGPLMPGMVLAHYRLESLLGEGGMGTVWRVTHTELDAVRALKLITPRIASDPNVLARFKREAQVMAKLTHPHAVIVHGVQLAEGSAYIEMEYIRGRSFAQVLRPGEPMPLAWVGHVLEQICDVLQTAHDLGIVHRDLKPSNLMLLDGRGRGREHVKVLDFGIAKIVQGVGTGQPNDPMGELTQPGSFLGTTPYASPEQIRSEDVDARSDLYSLGVLLYEMLTGFRPFVGSNNLVMAHHLSEPPPRFLDRNPLCEVPEAIERVVLALLEKDADRRPRSASVLADAFRQAMAEVATDVEPIRKPAATMLPGTSYPISSPDSTIDATGVQYHDGVGETPIVREDSEAVRPPRRWVRKALIGVAVAGLIAGAAARLQGWVGKGQGEEPQPIPRGGSEGGHVVTPPPPPAPNPDRQRIAQSRDLWKKQGFRAESDDASPDHWPDALIRVSDADDVRFDRQEGPRGVYYLPEGYRADGEECDADGWPIWVRREDGVLLRRVSPGTMQFVQLDNADKLVPVGPAFRLSGFYVQKYEVTNREVAQFAKDRPEPSRFAASREYHRKLGEIRPAAAGDHPARGVPWADADAFARRWKGRLPTEAQWEYVARSGDTPKMYVWEDRGEPDRQSGLYGMPPDNSDDPTAKVGGFPDDRNNWDVFDLTGNVREWCRDRQVADRSAAGPLDPEVPFDAKLKGAEMVVRGSSWAQTKPYGRTFDRSSPIAWDAADPEKLEDVGFRTVLECPDLAPPTRP